MSRWQLRRTDASLSDSFRLLIVPFFMKLGMKVIPHDDKPSSYVINSSQQQQYGSRTKQLGHPSVYTSFWNMFW